MAIMLSLSETRSLAQKAMRGAGAPWGLAEEAGRAAEWLEAHGMQGLATLLVLLDKGISASTASVVVEQGESCWAATTGELCPISAGTVLSDMSALHPDQPMRFERVACPLLLWPFAELADRRLVVPTDLAGVEDCTVVALPGPALPMQPKGRQAVDPRVTSALTAYAHKTYVPATTASRLSGAGAGTSDND